MTSSVPPPESILIVGSGVFGLTTLYTLLESPKYSTTKITLLAPAFPHTNASEDHSRIIRSDYSCAPYARLAAKAQTLWRTSHWGADGRYSEAGLVLTSSRAKSYYVQNSLDNVVALEAKAELETSKRTDQSRRVQVLNSASEIRAATGLPVKDEDHSVRCDDESTTLGEWGYLNPTAGWADATASLGHLYNLITSIPRPNLTIIPDKAVRLLYRKSDDLRTTIIIGAETACHGSIHASLTILATGAWTPSLFDLRGRAVCTMQPIMYVPLEKWELEKTEHIRTILNLESGLFVIPPHEELGYIKVARHCLGWRWGGRVKVHNGLVQRTQSYRINGSTQSNDVHTNGVEGEEILVSLPPPPPLSEQYVPIPASSNLPLQNFLTTLFPFLDLPPPPAEPQQIPTPPHRAIKTRLCPYLDTPNGDFLICYPNPARTASVPDQRRFQGVFLATGDSGHGFKFLPVLGEQIVRIFERGWRDDQLGRRASVDGNEDSSENEELNTTKELERLWAWDSVRTASQTPREDQNEETAQNALESFGTWGDVQGTEDGSRGPEGGILGIDRSA